MCENIAKQPTSAKSSTNNAVHVHRHVGSPAQLQLAVQPDAASTLSTQTYHLFINAATL